MTHLQAGEWREAIACFEQLTERYGVNQDVQRALNEARFKYDLDQKTRIRPKRWVIPWRRILMVGTIMLAAAGLIVLGAWFFSTRVQPAVALAEEERTNIRLLAEGDAQLQAGQLDAAETSYQTLLTRVPDHEKALAGLEKVKAGREVQALCAEAQALFTAGDLTQAREKFTELLVRSPGSCDAEQRVAEINRRLQVSDLFEQAEADYRAGNLSAAAAAYEELRAADATYQSNLVAERLYDVYLKLGQDIIKGDATQAVNVPRALDYFNRALALRPKDAAAKAEQRLASMYLAGETDYAEGRWDGAADMFGAIYEQRPDFLQGSFVTMLYDAYIRSGDQHRDMEDYHYAWEQYRKAAQLNVGDSVLARGRMATVEPLLTPTATPTFTPTPTPTHTPTPIVIPTPVPTATPPPPLKTLRNRIIFFADKEGQEGLWVMNPDGSNRQYLGDTKDLRQQYDALIEKDRLSPDGRYRVYVTRDEGRGDKNPQIYIQSSKPDENGRVNTWRVTALREVCYDPVWAPDGSKIAFVSQDRTSDDIWTVLPDGGDPWNLTPNEWEWDKHPSWSPDSTRIVFWTNREGTKQIYIMDSTGRNQRKISGTTWDEYDPIWVK